MRIKRELLRVQTRQYAPDGSRVEPEQQLAVTTIEVDAPARLQGQDAVVGTAAGEFQVHSTALEIANAARSHCFACKHFDRKAWALRRRQLEHGTPEQQTKLRKIRVLLLNHQDVNFQNLHADPSGDMDIEAALSSLGLCRPMTEMNRDPVTVFPSGCCPAEVCPEGQPLGLFEPTTNEADRAGSAAFDQIMMTAAGR